MLVCVPRSMTQTMRETRSININQSKKMLNSKTITKEMNRIFIKPKKKEI